MPPHSPSLQKAASSASVARSSEEVYIDVFELESTSSMSPDHTHKATVTLTSGTNDAALSDSAFSHDPFSLARIREALFENCTSATILADRATAMKVSLPPLPISPFLPCASSAGKAAGTKRPWAPALPNPLAFDVPANGHANAIYPEKLSPMLSGASLLERPTSFERAYGRAPVNTPTASRLLSLRTARSHIFTRQMDWLEPDLAPDLMECENPGLQPDHIAYAQRWLSVARTCRRTIRLKPYEILSSVSMKPQTRERYAAQLLANRRLIHGSEKVMLSRLGY